MFTPASNVRIVFRIIHKFFIIGITITIRAVHVRKMYFWTVCDVFERFFENKINTGHNYGKKNHKFRPFRHFFTESIYHKINKWINWWNYCLELHNFSHNWYFILFESKLKIDRMIRIQLTRARFLYNEVKVRFPRKHIHTIRRCTHTLARTLRLCCNVLRSRDRNSLVYVSNEEKLTQKRKKWPTFMIYSITSK